MSGICGLFNLDDAPVANADLRAMTAVLEKRGPDRTNIWLNEHVGIGHTLLATTPDSLFERQPFKHAETGCVITADVRLDNRDELLCALELREKSNSTGDAELILTAYLAWGEQCLDHLLGDFAFAIIDPRNQSLFCARDHSSVRPLYYHYSPGMRFLFASDARAILVLPQVPYQINAGRVADFLVSELEWIDYTSTFFEDVFRLPPGHKATLKSDDLAIAEYWKPQPGPDPGPMSQEDYAEGFLEVFSTAVEARLRTTPGAAGSMLSGGMDSGSVVAIGKEILRNRGGGPLLTYSCAQYRDSDCAESQAIYAAAAMPDISPTLIHPDALDSYLDQLASGFEEPFDGHFTFLKAIYLAAQERGQRVVLDGAAGDIVLGEGSYIARLIRAGQFKLALAEIRGEKEFWGDGSVMSSLVRYSRGMLIPEVIKKRLRGARHRHHVRSSVRESLISSEFAKAVDIESRFERMREMFPFGWTPDYAIERCNAIRPNLTGGRERYARIAASAGVESSDPFIDRRVVEFCARLPGQVRMKDGWPKIILRELMADRLPDEVRWCRGKPHIGWMFNAAVTRQAIECGALEPNSLEKGLRDYVDAGALANAWQKFGDHADTHSLHTAHMLLIWLRETVNRPVVCA